MYLTSATRPEDPERRNAPETKPATPSHPKPQEVLIQLRSLFLGTFMLQQAVLLLLSTTIPHLRLKRKILHHLHSPLHIEHILPTRYCHSKMHLIRLITVALFSIAAALPAPFSADFAENSLAIEAREPAKKSFRSVPVEEREPAKKSFRSAPIETREPAKKSLRSVPIKDALELSYTELSSR